MLTSEDIKKLSNYLLDVFKDVFMTKDDGQRLERKINMIQTSLDGLTKKTKDDGQEVIVLNKRMKAAEDWIDQAAPKLGIDFKH